MKTQDTGSGTQKVSVTAVLATKNEAKNLPICLAALKSAQRVVVVDSNSSDDTVKVASAAGAEVVQFEFNGKYPKKRQWALDNLDINTEWVMLVDADEVVTSKLWDEVRSAVTRADVNAFLVLKEFHFMGRKFRFGGFSHRAVFLFRAGKARFECLPGGCAGEMDMEVHERLLVEGSISSLSSKLKHEDFKGLEAYLERHRKYARWEAAVRSTYLQKKEWDGNSVQARFFGNVQERRRFLKSMVIKMPFEPAIWFLYHFVLRLGFLEGRRGFKACMIRAGYIADVRRRMTASSGENGNIICVNQYYLPDLAPTGRALHDLARFLAEENHNVTVLCSRVPYEGGRKLPRYEEIDGVNVRRIGSFGFGRASSIGRLLDYASFSVNVFVQLLIRNQRADVYLALSTPPFIGCSSRSVARMRGGAHAHWIMDVYPDAMVAHGMIKSGGLAHKALAGKAKRMLSGSSAIITLTDDMARAVSRYSGSIKVQCVPLWSDLDASKERESVLDLRSERGWEKSEMVLMYSGNMGLGHLFDEFLEAALNTRSDKEIRWVFAGGGIMRGEIERYISSKELSNAEVLDYVSPEKLRTHLQAADVHLVSMSGSWAECIAPSKLQGIFAASRPVIFIGDGDSHMARWIRDADAGWIVSEGDVVALLAAVKEARIPAVCEERGMNARLFAEKHFSRHVNCARIAKMLMA